MKFDYPFVALVLGLTVIGISVWHAQRNKISFDLFDLLMENGRVSKIAVSYMLVLLVSTFVVLKMLYDKSLTDVVFGIYCGSWITPLVAKVVFNKPDAPIVTSFTKTTETAQVTEPMPGPIKETP